MCLFAKLKIKMNLNEVIKQKPRLAPAKKSRQNYNNLQNPKPDLKKLFPRYPSHKPIPNFENLSPEKQQFFKQHDLIYDIERDDKTGQEKAYKCDQLENPDTGKKCTSRFRSERYLKAHIACKHYPELQPRWICRVDPNCLKVLGSKRNLGEHIKKFHKNVDYNLYKDRLDDFRFLPNEELRKRTNKRKFRRDDEVVSTKNGRDMIGAKKKDVCASKQSSSDANIQETYLKLLKILSDNQKVSETEKTYTRKVSDEEFSKICQLRLL